MDNLNQIPIKDIIEWDTINWGKLISFIDANRIDFTTKQILEIGANNGGISLFCASRGGKVVCSDLNGPTEKAKDLHKKYGLEHSITYEAIDALNIPDKYNSHFDIIIFKSVLGGIGHNNNIERQKLFVENVYRSLKKDGILIFAENMKSTGIHVLLRKKFNKWGTWHYETENEIMDLFSRFTLVSKQYVGLLGCFGRNEGQRVFLGKLDDAVFDKIVSERHRYIGMYLFKKL